MRGCKAEAVGKVGAVATAEAVWAEAATAAEEMELVVAARVAEEWVGAEMGAEELVVALVVAPQVGTGIAAGGGPSSRQRESCDRSCSTRQWRIALGSC